MSRHNSFPIVSQNLLSLPTMQKFPYLEKDKYEIWANEDGDRNRMLIKSLEVVQQRNSLKRLGKDAKGNTIVHPRVSLDEPSFAIWWDEESKKTTEDHAQTAVNQNFLDKEERPTQGIYDRIQKILSHSVEIMCKQGQTMMNIKPEVSKTLPLSGHKCLGIKITRGGLINDFADLLIQFGMKNLDLKWQMAMLSLRINRFEKSLMIRPGRIMPAEKTRLAQKEKKEWEVKFEATLARFEKWKESSKNLEKLINSSMSTRTKIGLGFKEYFGKDEVFDLSTPSVMYPEPVEEVKPLSSWFVKAGEMHAVPPSITGTFMPTPYKSDIEETQVSGGSKSDNKTSETLSESNDSVSCDNSDKSSDSETYASCDSSLRTLPESDVEDPNSTAGSPSFSCSENVKSPRIICNNSGMNNRNVCKNNSVRVKKCFVCGSKLHLIKDCDFYNCIESVPCKYKASSVPADSRNSSASVTTDGSC
ncbi:hypothetical protein Tco_0308824 [Tanacetum coccineum]